MTYYTSGDLSTIVGLDTIVGADSSAASAPRLVPQRLDEARELLLGFGPQSIAGGATTVFTTQPQLPFRPSRFVIPSSTVTNFSVNDLKIGKNSQFLSSAAVPAAVFSELAVGVALGLDTCNVGQQITVSITAGPVGQQYTFAAALIGTSIQ